MTDQPLLATGKSTLDITPPPGAFIKSLRSMGYSLETALADIIDNSITAGADRVEILADYNGQESRIGIVDNGRGMSFTELHNAMLLGGSSVLMVRDPMDLGRFGFGLKTASISQGRRLTVLSRTIGMQDAVATMDLDHISESNSWEVTLPEAESVVWADKIEEHGTLVLWEHLDRILVDDNYAVSEKAFNEAVSNAIEHLQLVFHRYLTGESDLKKVSISVNGNALTPFDPFFRTRSTVTDPETIPYGSELIRLQAFTLPHHSKVSQSEWAKHAGPRGYMQGQGFYVYRAKRLIHYGSWFGIIAPTELTKLARIQLDVPTNLDADWQVDVRKASINPPRAIRQKLKSIIDPLIRPSRRAVTRRGVPLGAQAQYPIWQRVLKDGAIVYSIDQTHPAIGSLAAEIPEASRSKLNALIQLISASLPLAKMIGDFAEKPDEIVIDGLGSASSARIRDILALFVASLIEMGTEPSDVEQIVLSNEPFQSQRTETRRILAEILEELTKNAG